MVVAYTYLSILEAALVELAQNIDNPTWKKEHESEKRLNLPKPVYCGGNKPNDMFCDLPPPRCATSFQPKVAISYT